jgi:6-phosphogluconolactonase (cycloisomerase 2 family)
MFTRYDSKAVLLAVVLGSVACGGSDVGSSAGVDAAGDARSDVGAGEGATDGNPVEAGPDAEVTEAGDDGARSEASDVASPDAHDDRSAMADGMIPIDAPDAGGPDASDARDASDGSVPADATDGTAADADDTAEGGARPVEVAYVATYLGGLHGFSIDMTTGALDPVPGSPFDKGAGFYALAVTTSGHFLYAADYLHGTVNGYRIVRDGSLQALPNSPLVMGAGPTGLTVDPAERFVFVGASEAPNRIFVYRIDRTTGALTAVEHSPFMTTDQPAVLAVDPESHFLFASSEAAPGIRVFAIGDATGDLTEVSGSPFGKSTVFGGGIAFSQVGHFVYNGGNGVNGFLYDTTSGAMTDLEGSPYGQALSDPTAMDIATDSMGGYVFAVHTSKEIISAFTMDQDRGKLSRIPDSPFPGAPLPYSLAIDPSVRFLFVGNDDADEISVYTIEATPGDGLRPVAKSPFAVHGLQPEFAFVQFP